MAGRSILIIDNDASLVAFLALVFEDQGYTVYTANDGTEGIELARQHRPAVVLSDMMMGRMHGSDVLVELRADPALRDTVVVIMSAKAYRSDIDRARALGATDYVVKPFRAEELLQLVEGHLRERGGEGGAADRP